MDKTCPKCNETKNLSLFKKNKLIKSGYENTCKACDATRRRIYYKDNKEFVKSQVRRYATKNPDKVKNTILKRHYNIGLYEYNELLKLQNGKCATCGGPPNGRGAKKGVFHVDHDHKTNNIRGLLCHHCNLLLGFANENTDILIKSIQYLNKYKVRIS